MADQMVMTFADLWLFRQARIDQWNARSQEMLHFVQIVGAFILEHFII